jgi:hypothetical protein
MSATKKRAAKKNTVSKMKGISVIKIKKARYNKIVTGLKLAIKIFYFLATFFALGLASGLATTSGSGSTATAGSSTWRCKLVIAFSLPWVN